MGSNPDVAAAIPALEREGVLTPVLAARLLRIAKGELVSVHAELRLLLYGGVLLVAAGAGLLVKQNLDRIGPTAVAGALAVAAGGCIAWAASKAPPFSRKEAPETHFARDYVLLLGALLAAADLAYVEVTFTKLGPGWTWHLLILAIFYGALGIRYDSKGLFSLSLTTFAAWRGFSLAVLARRLEIHVGNRVLVEAVACGLAFVLLGWALVKLDFKRHFEAPAVHIGWGLVLLGEFYRINRSGGTFLLLGTAALLATIGYRSRRFWLLAMGVVAAEVGATIWVAEHTNIRRFEPLLLWLVVSGLLVVVGLGLMHRRLREPR